MQQSELKVTICIYEIDKELISIIYKELKQTIKKKKKKGSEWNTWKCAWVKKTPILTIIHEKGFQYH